MLTAVDPKYKKWRDVKEDLQNIANDVALPVQRNDNAMCLMHGFHHQVTFSFRDHIRCVACKSSNSREEFLVNHGNEQTNVLHVRKYMKQDIETTESSQKDTSESTEAYSSRFPLKGPPQKHLEWIPKHRLFVAFGKDKHLRLFADTMHRCKAVSAPTVCPMPVLSLVYLEATDEIVTGGVGVIQPWKLRLYTASVHSFDNDEEPRITKETNRRNSTKVQAGVSQTASNLSFGPGRQMFQARPPYPCDLHPDEWVLRMRVYQTSSAIPTSNERLLVALCHSTILAIDYMKRCELWCVRLYSPQAHYPVEALDNRDRGDVSVLSKKPSKKCYIHGHESLSSCDLFPKFGYFFTGGGEGTIRVWHVMNFGLITVLRGHLGAIVSLIVHPKYPMLISASRDQSIRFWCLETFTMTQRIDTGHTFESLRLSIDSNYFYYYSKNEVCLYRLTNLYYLYSVLHSSAVKLTRIEGVPERAVPGKVLASLQDGSVAVLCPLTGLLLTFIYPMITFKTFRDVVYDPYHNIAYVRVHDGSLMQCDTSTNPSQPCKVYTPTQPYDQAVVSVTSLILPIVGNVTAIIAGLRNGQIVLVHPNNLRMPTTQAHSVPVEFLGVAELPYETHDSAVKEKRFRQRQHLISLGADTVRTWSVLLAPHTGQHEWMISLEIDLTITLPSSINERKFMCMLRDRLCVCARNCRIYVVMLQPPPYKNEARRCALTVDEEITTQTSKIRFGSPSQGARFVTTTLLDTDMLKTHHPDYEHATMVTAMATSPELNIFASASEDSIVKIWDEENRLVRELLLAPHRITALCFPNGRDLVVAMSGRLCMVDFCMYITKAFIKDRNVDELQFYDDVAEPAIPFNNEIATVLKIEEIDTAALQAAERTERLDSQGSSRQSRLGGNVRRHGFSLTTDESTESFDDVDEGRALRSFVLWKQCLDKHVAGTNRSESTGSKLAFRKPKRLLGVFSETRAMHELARERWRYAVEQKMLEAKLEEELKEDERSDSSDSDAATDVGAKEKEDTRENLPLADEVTNAVEAKECDSMAKIDFEGIFDRIMAKRLLYGKYPIAPDGHIQNSVIRQRVKPASLILENAIRHRRGGKQGGKLGLYDPYSWTILSEPESLTRILDDIDSNDTANLPFKYKFEAGTSLARFAKMAASVKGLPGSLGKFRKQLMLERLDAVQSNEFREDKEYMDEKEINELWEDAVKKILFFDEAGRRRERRKGSAKQRRRSEGDTPDDLELRKSRSDMSLTASALNLFDEAGERLSQDQIKRLSRVMESLFPALERPRLSYLMEKDATRLLRQTSEQKSAWEQWKSSSEESSAATTPTEAKTAEQSSSATGMSLTGSRVSAGSAGSSYADSQASTKRSRSMRPQGKSSQEVLMAKVKGRLKEERKTSMERSRSIKSGVPQVLKEIIDAPWFRKRLKKVTPDSVVDALLKLGATTRVFAHEKAIEAMLLVAQEYPVQETGSAKNLSTAMMTRIQEHLARFMKPSYDVTNDFAKHPMRVQLADNALDALISGIPLDENLRDALIRLLTDEDEGLREKAKVVLEMKLSITDFEELLQEFLRKNSEQIDQEEPVEEEQTNDQRFMTTKAKEALAVRRHMEKRLGKQTDAPPSSPPARQKRVRSFQVIPLKKQGSRRNSKRKSSTLSDAKGKVSEQSVMSKLYLSTKMQDSRRSSKRKSSTLSDAKEKMSEQSSNESKFGTSSDSMGDDQSRKTSLRRKSRRGSKKRKSMVSREPRNDKVSVAQLLADKWRKTGATAGDDRLKKAPSGPPPRQMTREEKKSIELRKKSPVRRQQEKKKFDAELRRGTRNILPLIAEAAARTQDKSQTQHRFQRSPGQSPEGGRTPTSEGRQWSGAEREKQTSAKVPQSPLAGTRGRSATESPMIRVTISPDEDREDREDRKISVGGSRITLRSLHGDMAAKFSKLKAKSDEPESIFDDLKQSTARLEQSSRPLKSRPRDESGVASDLAFVEQRRSDNSLIAASRARIDSVGLDDSRLSLPILTLHVGPKSLAEGRSTGNLVLLDRSELSSTATNRSDPILPVLDQSEIAIPSVYRLDTVTSAQGQTENATSVPSEIKISSIYQSDNVTSVRDQTDPSMLAIDQSKVNFTVTDQQEIEIAEKSRSKIGLTAIDRSKVVLSHKDRPDSGLPAVDRLQTGLLAVYRSKLSSIHLTRSDLNLPAADQSDIAISEMNQSQYSYIQSKTRQPLISHRDLRARERDQRGSSFTTADESVVSFQESYRSESRSQSVQSETAYSGTDLSQWNLLRDRLSELELERDRQSASGYALTIDQSTSTIGRSDQSLNLPPISKPVGDLRIELLKSYLKDAAQFVKTPEPETPEQQDQKIKEPSQLSIGVPQSASEDEGHETTDDEKAVSQPVRLPPLPHVPDSGFESGESAKLKPRKKRSVASVKTDDWREALRTLKDIRTKTKEQNRLPKRKRLTGMTGFKITRRFPQRLVQIAPGERIASHYSLFKGSKDIGPDTSHVCPLPSKNSVQVCRRGAGESRYGIMSIHWKGEKPQRTDGDVTADRMTCRNFRQQLHVNCCLSRGNLTSHPINRRAAHRTATDDVRKRIALLIGSARSRDRAKHQLRNLDIGEDTRSRDPKHDMTSRDKMTWEHRPARPVTRVE